MQRNSTMNEDMEVDDEIFQLQKERLRRHLPFVKRMLEKVRNTTFEKKWQQMYTCIMSDRKRWVEFYE